MDPTPSNINPAYLMPGTKVGFYSIVDLIGAGAMGATYRAERAGKVYALKIATFNLAQLDPEGLRAEEARIRREVAALNGLDHPNIVAIRAHDVWPEPGNGYPYLVMDYVDGPPLLEWRERKKPSLAVILRVFRTLGTALQEMHRLHIFHRDLKSANVLVRTADDEPVVIDFGIARPLSTQTVTRVFSMVGTTPFWSPEYCAYAASDDFAEGRPFVNMPQTDLWALGLLFHEALTNRFPFETPAHVQLRQLMDIIQNQVIPPPSEHNPAVPPVVDALLSRLLAKNPDERMSSGMELAAAVDACMLSATPEWLQPFPVPGRVGRGAPTPRATSPSVQALAVAPSAEVVRDSAILQVSTPSSSALPVPSSAGVPLSPGPQPSPSTPPPSAAAQTPAQVAPVASAAGFSPPTSTGLRYTPPEPVQPPVEAQLGSAIQDVQEALRRPEAPARPPTRTWMVAAGAATAAAVLVGLVMRQESPAPEGPRTLLEAYSDGGTSPLAAQRSAVELPPPSGASPSSLAQEGLASRTTAAPQPPPSPVPASAVAPAAQPASRAPRGGEAARINAELARTYGRPTVTPDGAVVTSREAAPPTGGPKAAAPVEVAASTPAWLQVSSSSGAADAGSGTARLGVPLGAHIKARLKSNLDSHACSNGPVEAELVRAHVEAGRVVLPSRTRLYGTCTTSSGRFLLTFTRVRLPSFAAFEFDGLALDAREQKTGLPADRSVAAAAPTTDVGAEVAKGAAGTVLSAVTGGTAADVVRGAGGTILQQAGAGAGSTPQDMLFLDAGKDFEVLVKAEF
jgi:serine/threonine protein kinase